MSDATSAGPEGSGRDGTAASTGQPDRDADSVLERLWDRLDGTDTRWFQLAFYGFLAVWMIVLLAVAWEWAWRDKLIAYIAGVPTIAFSLVKLGKLWAPERYEAVLGFVQSGDEVIISDRVDLEETYQEIRSGAESVGRARRDRIAYGVRMTVWAMALPVLMYYLGFANALVLFVLAFGLRFYDTVREAVGVTVIFSVMMYLFFWQVIGMSPWTGTLDLPSIVDVLGLG